MQIIFKKYMAHSRCSMAASYFCYSLRYPQTVFLHLFQSHRVLCCSPSLGRIFWPSSPQRGTTGLMLSVWPSIRKAPSYLGLGHTLATSAQLILLGSS